MTEIITSLRNHVLVATKELAGSDFEHAVIYVCNNDEEGSMGVVINQPISLITFDEIISDMGIEGRVNGADPIIYNGGPVDRNRGFIVHTNDYQSPTTDKVGNDIYLTATTSIVKDIAEGDGPKNTIFCLGYAGWSAHQLEEELAENCWLVLPATPDLLFGTSPNMIFEKCEKLLRFNHNAFLSPIAGDA